jgi:hypothetical protein
MGHFTVGQTPLSVQLLISGSWSARVEDIPAVCVQTSLGLARDKSVSVPPGYAIISVRATSRGTSTSASTFLRNATV